MGEQVAKRAARSRPVSRWYHVHYFSAPEYRTRTYRRTPPGLCSFGIVLSGSMEVEWEHQGRCHRLTAQAGDVTFWGPSSARWATNAKSPRFTAYGIDAVWRPPKPGLPPLAHDQRGLLRILGGEMLAIYVDDLPRSLKQQLLEGYFHALVAEYQRLTATPPHPMLEKLRLFVAEHIAQPIRVGDLARQFGLGKRRFQDKYKTATGRSPMAEVKWVRAERARIMILNLPQLPLKEVARRVGLRDHRELGRVLKRCYGVRARHLARSAIPVAGFPEPENQPAKD